ncbi:MAG TPA: ribosome-associated translation inhibitor RaiA [Vicinamibacterales bacterium]|nr:ribosome-associated translation inhibitor RaiA [Vicinamibacterales bacterium]
MRVELTGRHVEITPPLRRLIERKLRKIERLLNDAAVSAQVVCSRQKYRHLVEMTLHARGDHLLHGVGQGDTWQAALRQVGERIEKQAHSLKERWRTRKRRAAGVRRLAAAAEAAAPPERARIVRSARYSVKPMTLDDAALRLEGGGDPFVVFRNAANDAINILYRRADGRLGLIEPET